MTVLTVGEIQRNRKLALRQVQAILRTVRVKQAETRKREVQQEQVVIAVEAVVAEVVAIAEGAVQVLLYLTPVS